MKILMIDDDGIKHSEVGKVVKKLCSDSQINVELHNSLTISEGRSRLQDVFYDLLILDLNIAVNLGDDLNETGGIEFIDEIIETNNIKKPSEIVILSSNNDSVQNFKEDLSKIGFTLYQFDKENWQQKISQKIEYMYLTKIQREDSVEMTDVCIVTAVDVETDQLLRLWTDNVSLEVQDDTTQYYKTNFLDKDGIKRSVIIAQQSEMGMPATAFLTTKMLYQFKPKYQIMVGIAGCTSDDANFGDILVPEQVWNYSSGKFKEDKDQKDGSTKLMPDSKSITLNPMIRDMVHQRDYREILSKIRADFSGEKPTTELNIIKGPMACGAAVVSDYKIIKEWVLGHVRGNVGLDMESYSLFYSCYNTHQIEAKPICIKSVSDFADKDKNDMYQKYAAYTSSAFAKHIMEKVLRFND